jgi:diadenosine tetraphosphate (Ap4A) HIT family hydrolase
MTDAQLKPCPFCNLPPERIILANGLALAIRDGFPISPGHTLIIPKRHVATFFETTTEERLAIFGLLDKAKLALDAELHPAAYNIGVNDGAAAGQTIPHLHFHLIPRYANDSADPRGGVRWIFPEKAKYWK